MGCFGQCSWDTGAWLTGGEDPAQTGSLKAQNIEEEEGGGCLDYASTAGPQMSLFRQADYSELSQQEDIVQGSDRINPLFAWVRLMQD